MDYDQGDGDNENITVLPEHLFIRTLQTIPPQDERTLKPWINAHNLILRKMVERQLQSRHGRA